MKTISLWLLTGAALGTCALAQPNGPDRYVFPIPQSRGVNGSFGEMRGTTFHFGLDVRTFERTGLPILAAADGYVSRVLVSYSGFGKAIYVQHTSDSNTTVYAHVDSFLRPIQREIEALQRRTGVFDQQLFYKPGEHPVKAGDTLAWSGNTGASQGPHLHYEVRAYNEWPMNPLAYHSRHIRDGLAPTLSRVAFEPLTAESRVAGRWEKLVIVPRRSEATSYHPGVVKLAGKVGLEFQGLDRLFGSRSWVGVYRVRWFLDEGLRFECRFDRHGWEHVRGVLHYHDAVYARRAGQRFQKAYRDVGMDVPLYSNLVNEGVIELTDTAVHQLRLEVEDYHGNRATFTTRVQRDEVRPFAGYVLTAPRVRPRWSQKRGLLLLSGSVPRSAAEAAVTVCYADSSRRTFYPAYANGLATTLVPLSGPAPVWASSGCWAELLRFDRGAVLAPESGRVLALGEGLAADFAADFPARSVFHPVLTEVSRRPGTGARVLSDIFSIGDPTLPVYQAFKVTLTLKEAARAADYRPGQIVLAQVAGGSFARVGSEARVGPSFSATTLSFGDYCLVADVSPPVARPQNFKPGGWVSAPYLKIGLDDDIAGVHPYKLRLSLDGEWQVPEYYNYQQAAFIRFKGRLKPGRHEVTLSATDYAGNSRDYRWVFFTR